MYALRVWNSIPIASLDDIVTFPFVTVIVPARNEENNLATCLGALLKCNYPKNLVEIIVVNDHSIDTTNYIAKTIGVKVLDLPQDKHGKKEAISHGFDYWSKWKYWP